MRDEDASIGFNAGLDCFLQVFLHEISGRFILLAKIKDMQAIEHSWECRNKQYFLCEFQAGLNSYHIISFADHSSIWAIEFSNA